MHSPGPLAGRGGAPTHRAGDPPPTDGLCSFCLPSDVRPLVGRTDDSANVCARDGGSGEGGKALTQKDNAGRARTEPDTCLEKLGRTVRT
jgi:hypothetical protein